MSRQHVITWVLAWLLSSASAAAWAGIVDQAAGNLPLAYLVQAGAYPWTGRLRALAWNPLLARTSEPTPHTTMWEAGARLDTSATASRHLYTSVAPAGMESERLVPLQWSALDAASQQSMAEGTSTATSGADKLAWLRGERGNAALRPRETRLADARGARVLVVPPPVWQPGKAGHAAFRERHRNRPHTVWLGTTDAWLHGFSATTGDELVGYMPRALLPLAAVMTEPKGALAPVPCPRPEAADVVMHREWRTVLLCGISAANEGGSTAGAFVLDISNAADVAPVRLIWELTATPALPLSARGPVRAAAFAYDEGPRWFAVTTVDAGASRAGLALIPLENTAGLALTWPLPERDCSGSPTTSALTGVSILSDMMGMAQAIYATDDSGQLWHFPVPRAPQRLALGTPVCLHKLPTAGHSRQAEPPLLVGAVASPLIVFGQGREVVAIPSRPAGVPARIVAEPADGGFLLRSIPGQGGNGWHLTLPNAGEQLDTLGEVFPGYLQFTTRAADGFQRAYLVLAATGESAGRAREGAPLQTFVTGQATSSAASFVATSVPGPSPQPSSGTSAAQAHRVTLWAVDGTSARPQSTAMATRRTGRISWREIVAPIQQELP
ncbi:pilus assembly protein PilY [Cupriavidus pinatubonensis]|uniref:pilus assembly protein PilY n=1 Tax=Cupriavidus pinatubonensis TaxID=248026 RepID=UPI00360E92AA